ncbi:MAG: FAD-binding protein, partial [Deltaproteobacteria bacterium]|nr:FAD-binding protein [Deltaproteobacteria bacterium]
MNITYVDSDVLIIGSGIAGLRAALEVSRMGRKPLLISKAPLGKANNTYLAGGLFAFGAKENVLPKHIAKTLKSGRGLNDLQLVETFAREAPAMVRELQEMGMGGVIHEMGLVTRQATLVGGPGITPPIVRACRERGVPFLEGVMVTDLIIADGACRGAIGFHKGTGEVFGFRAGALLLATGGAGSIYGQNNNAPGITGDGYSLAMRAGMELMDMEFVQFYPMVRSKGGLARMIVPAVLADLGKITNRLGEDLKKKYDLREKPIALASRDRFAQALFREISRGNGVDGGIPLDLRHVDDSRIPFEEKAKEILRRNLHYDTEPIKIAPACHHTMGGVPIDASGGTAMTGLFAAGEVVGGIHGANRMGGNALTESLVFGALAARAAVAHADSLSEFPQFQTLTEQTVKETFGAVMGNSKNSSKAHAIMGRLGRLLWERAGIVRSADSLKQSLGGIERILTELEGQKASHPRDLCRIFECRNAALCGMAITVAALK